MSRVEGGSQHAVGARPVPRTTPRMSFATLLPKFSRHAAFATILFVVSCSRTPDTEVSMLAPGGMNPSEKARTSPDGTVVFCGNGTLRMLQRALLDNAQASLAMVGPGLAGAHV